MITASALDRIAACPQSETLGGSNRTSGYATQGTALHRFFQLCQSVGREEALAQMDEEWRDVCDRIETDSLPLDGNYAAEVAFAFDHQANSARELGRGTDRDYSQLRPTEIAGTCDLVGIVAHTAYVADYKTGYQDIPRASESLQLKFYALCAARVYGVKRVIADIIRVQPDTEPYVDRAAFDGFDLARVARQIAAIVTAVDTARELSGSGQPLTVTEGKHCRYCPALPICPAKVALVRELGASADIAEPGDLVGELSTARAAEALRRLDAIDSVSKLARKRIYELARSRPIALGDGQFLGEVTAPGREKLDGDGTYQAVAALYGTAVAEIAAPADRSATKKALREALRAVKQNGTIDKIAPAERELLATLRDSGCARKPIVTKVSTYDAPECRTDACREQALEAGGTCRDCAVDAEFQERQSA